jgi:Ca2+-binding RTX toxin-like protein
VDLGDLTSQSWTGELAFNPDGASNSLTFTNASKSTLTSNNTQSSDAKGSSYTAAVKLKSGDNAINFDGSYSNKVIYGTTAGSGTSNNTLAFTFTDTKGTTDTSDDVASNSKVASASTYSSANGVTSQTTTGTAKDYYSSSGYVESLDVAFKFENTVNTSGDSTPIQEKQTFTINSYAFSSASDAFSLKIGGGTIVNTSFQNGQNVDTMTYSFKNVEWNENWRFKMTTANVSSFTLTDTELNLGAGSGDDSTQVYQDLSDNLLSKLLAEDNVVTLKGGWYSPDGGFDAGGGNDKVTGSFRADFIIGGAGNDTLLGGLGKDTLVGGAGADKLAGGAGSDIFQFSLTGDSGDISWTGLGGNAPIALFDQILDFAKGQVGKGDVISLGADQVLQVGGSDYAATSTEASINQSTGVTTFAAGSGKTLSDAVIDIATRMNIPGDEAGDFAFFKVNNKGSYYAFISDGSEGVTEHDVVVQLAGVTNINQIDLTDGHLAIIS